MGGVQRQVQRAGMARAKEMSMLARRYDPATLERWGLINLVVPDETLEEATLAVAEEFANGPTLAHAATKQLAYIAANEGVLAADDAMEELQKPIRSEEHTSELQSLMRISYAVFCLTKKRPNAYCGTPTTGPMLEIHCFSNGGYLTTPHY